MLEFIKRIFHKEELETEKSILIGLQNLDEWIDEKSKPFMEEEAQKIEEVLMRINEETQKTNFNLEILENAKLQNPNVPFKAKQYMEGNRKAYIKAISSFIGNIEINNKEYFYLLDFCSSFDEIINELNKSTFRSYTILQEFFANETGNIAENLKNIDNLFKELKSVLNDERIVAVNTSREKIKSLKMRIKHKINLEVELKNIEADLKLANEQKDAALSNIESFKQSDEHKEFLMLNEEKESKESAFHADESQILQSFSVLERALRKYSHIAFEHEEIILDYLRRPVETLANDKALKILQILKSLQNLINEDKLDKLNKLNIDAKKKEKSIEEIKKLNAEFIMQFLKKYSSLKADIAEINNKMKALGITEKLKYFNKQLDDADSLIEKSQDECSSLKNDILKITNSIENLKGEIESDIKKIFLEAIKIGD